MSMRVFSCASLALILSACQRELVSGEEYAHQSVISEIEEGNYTYYKIGEPGHVVVELKSIEGDADLYISVETPSPTFDFEEHTYSSATCGLDKVEIDQEVARPLYIGVYGYPQFALSKYELTVTIYKYTKFGEEHVPENEGDPTSADSPDQNMYDTKSRLGLLWPVLTSILEIVIEVLL